MPHSKTKKIAAKKIDFPTMFYREAPIEKIMANTAKTSAPIMSASDLRKRQIMMWSGVVVIMAFLIGLWGAQIKANLKNTGSVAEDLNFLNKSELSNILKKGNVQQAEMKILNAEQINELKKKIENKNTSKPL